MKVEVIRRTTATVFSDTNMVIELEDLAPKQGRATLRLPGVSHSAYWANMGDRDVRQYILDAPDTKYLVGHFDRFGTLYRKINVEHMKEVLASDIAGKNFSADHQTDLLGRLNNLDAISDIQGIMMLVPEYMNEIYGPNWVIEVGKFQGHHENYQALVSAVETLQLVVKEHLG